MLVWFFIFIFIFIYATCAWTASVLENVEHGKYLLFALIYFTYLKFIYTIPPGTLEIHTKPPNIDICIFFNFIKI